MEERLSPANDVLWGPDHPPLNVILRGPIAKSVKWAQIPRDCTESNVRPGFAIPEDLLIPEIFN